MCGIAGIVTLDARRYESHLQRMVKALSHRGPDSNGLLFFKNCGLGHTRLSIVDLETGQQPMLSHNSQAAITFNGEIYGYQEMRESLEGYPFCTTSDTEIILALYEKYGDELFAKLPGMFSFALWNEAEQELVCGRDRFGEKPFYYAFGADGEFVFASEIKALLVTGLVRPVLDRSSLIHYIRYLYVKPNRTIYQTVHTLPPGHMLRVRHGRVSTERYWQLPQTRLDINLREAADELRRLLHQAVQRCLIADVPVGAFLSGGLDSSSIVAVASRDQAKPKTFSFGFEESVSELPFAREVAELYQTDHIILSDANVDIGELLLIMQDVYDEPFADSSNIPTWLIAKLARQHVKSVLTGDGADELLAGYSFWYKPLWYMQRYKKQQSWLIPFVQLAIHLTGKLGMSSEPNLGYELKGLNHRRDFSTVIEAHRAYKQYFSDTELVQFGLDCSESIVSPASRSTDYLDDVLREDVEEYLPGDILVKVDRASMAHGLEVRAPFLDVDLATFCISLPTSLKINSTSDKLVLREAFSHAWPPLIRTRSKQGFGAPVDQWLKCKSVRDLKEHYLHSPKQKLFSLLPFDQTRAVVGKDNYKTWILLVLALWLDKHDLDMV